MGYTKIVFLVETPILNRYRSRYGIEELRQQGFDVTIFDMSPVLLPITYKTITDDLCDYEQMGFYRFFSMKDIENALKALDPDNTLLICSMGYVWEYRKVFQTIKKCGLHFCYFMQEISSTDHISTQKTLLQKLSPSNIRAAIGRRIPRSWHGVGQADFIIGCGANEVAVRSFMNGRLCGDDCPVYYFHSSNYEETLAIAKEERLIEEKYCVLIDQYLPYHTDCLAEGAVLDARTYYGKMNRVFSDIEEKFDIKVVIAAHPRANYEQHPECFGDRIVLKNQTCRLIKDAEFVIQHFSNSMSYIMLFNKPILVVTTDEMNQLYGNIIEAICKDVNAVAYNVDERSSDELENYIFYDSKLYCNYVREYMKKDYCGVLEGEPLWTQIGKFLREL